MKENIHPEYKTIKVKCSCGNEFDFDEGGALVRIHLVTDGDCHGHCSTGCGATKET